MAVRGSVGPHAVAGKPLTCLICGYDQFVTRNASLLAGWGLGPVRKMRQVVCARCDHVHWFRRW